MKTTEEQVPGLTCEDWSKSMVSVAPPASAVGNRQNGPLPWAGPSRMLVLDSFMSFAEPEGSLPPSSPKNPLSFAGTSLKPHLCRFA